MNIDMRTIVLINVISSIFTALMLLLTWRTLSNEKGLQEWAIGSLCAALASCLQILRGTVSDFLSILLPNALFILAVGYFYIGSRRLWGLPRGFPWHWLGCLTLFCSSAYFTYIDPNLQLRVCIISAATAFGFLGAAVLFVKTLTPATKLPQWIAAFIFGLEGIALLLRAVFALFDNSGQNYFGPASWVNLSAGFIVLLFDLCMPVTIALLISARLQAKLTLQSQRDELTGIANRRHFNETFFTAWSLFKRHQRPLSLISIDVDFFKQFNDRYGHLAGDRCLQELSAALQSTLSRPSDLVARYGGEEFIILLPETAIAGAIHLAQKINAQIETLNIAHAASSVASHVTVSMGVVCILSDAYQKEDLLKAADRCLYQAKNAGRNRIETQVLE